MTRKEIKEWGQHMADKVFHLKHKEAHINGTIQIETNVCAINVNFNELCKKLIDAGFENGDSVVITIKK